MSHLGAVYSKCKNVEYIPSSKMKDKAAFTTTSRRFVGVLNIDGIEYLTYHISEINEYEIVVDVFGDLHVILEYGLSIPV